MNEGLPECVQCPQLRGELRGRLLAHMREDIEKIAEPKARALFDSSSESLARLGQAFDAYRAQSEAARRHGNLPEAPQGQRTVFPNHPCPQSSPTPRTMSYLIPAWRSFLSLTSESESASASVCCSFSFATLEVACCRPGLTSFALTEQKQSDAWRWAICSTEGLVLQTGCEPTQLGAKRVAEEALRLEEA